MFRVGMKVVCVDATSGVGKWAPGEELHEGRIYTISSLHHHPEEGRLVAWLEECQRSEISRLCWGPLAGYGLYRFRPVVERKTDISIFTAMLNPTSEPVTA